MKKFSILFLSIIFLVGCGIQRLDLEEGQQVELIGSRSETPWQHMVDIKADYPYINYIDFEGGDQRVVYTKQLLICPEKVSFKGTVIKIEGESKNPDSDEVYTDLQIQSDEFECL